MKRSLVKSKTHPSQNAIDNYSVVGGASKLLKYFENNYKPEKLISYADKRWSIGNLYVKLNFELIRVSPPNYFYVDGQKRLHRFNFRKDILISKYGCSPEDTENNFTKNVLGLKRIYDCGSLVYQKIIKSKFINIVIIIANFLGSL